MPTRACNHCGEHYTRPPCMLGQYCGKACMYAARRAVSAPKRGYRNVLRPGHPLANHRGHVLEHRVLLYDKIGPGEHPCFHCQKPLRWMPAGSGRTADSLMVDHFDRDKTNNDPSNLVPSCNQCNVRNSDKVVRDDELFVVSSAGTRQRAAEHVCRTCQEPFLVSLSAMRSNPRVGQYCSRRCMYDRNRAA